MDLETRQRYLRACLTSVRQTRSYLCGPQRRSESFGIPPEPDAFAGKARQMEYPEGAQTVSQVSSWRGL